MKNLKSYLSAIILCFAANACSDGWFDANSEWWRVPNLPIQLNYWNIDFENTEDDLIEHFKYVGDYSSVDYSIYTSAEWISIPKESGQIKKGEDISFHILLNPSMLKEGLNLDTIIYSIEKLVYKVPVSAVGKNQIESGKKSIDFGNSSVRDSISFKSLTGSRVLHLRNIPEWITPSATDIILPEYNDNKINEKWVYFTCQRKDLPIGVTNGTIDVVSDCGMFSSTIAARVEMIEQNESQKLVGNYIFRIERVYRENDDVVVQLYFKNDKYPQSQSLDTKLSYAKDETGKRFTVKGNGFSLKSNESTTTYLRVADVPDSICLFSELSIKFNNVPSSVIFENISF